MMRLTLFLILILPLSLTAQERKKNVIKPLCIASDYMSQFGNNAFSYSYSFEYERQFSKRVSFDISYHKSLIKNAGVEYDNGPLINGKDYVGGDYTEDFMGFGYESRYYFNDFETDGTSSGYIGFIYQMIRGTQTLSNARYKDQVSNDISIIEFPKEHFTIHRPGIRIGHVWQGALFSDLYAGVFYNNPSYSLNNSLVPYGLIPVSFMVGWNIGIPF